jgi:hypothetical protein
VTAKRWLISSVVLAVLVVTAVIVLAIPNRHVCGGDTHPISIPSTSMTGAWVCVPDGNAYVEIAPAPTDRRVPLRVGIALGGVALAVALGVGLHKATPRGPQPDAETSVHSP